MTSFILVYIGHFDLHKDDGKSINEREFVSALLRDRDIASVYVGPQSRGRVAGLEGLPCLEIPLPSRSFGSHLVYQMRLLRVLLRLYKRTDGRMVVCTRPNFASWVPPVFCRIFNVPLIVKFAGQAIPLINQRKDIPTVYRRIAGWVYAFNGRAADRIWAVTDQIGKYWRTEFEIPARRIFVLPNGVNTERFYPNGRGRLPESLLRLLLDGDPLVGYAGGLRKSLGIHLLINAAVHLKKQGFDCTFVVAGDGDYGSELASMVSAAGIEDRFILAGRLPYECMADFYRRCDVLTVPFTQRFVRRFGSSSQKLFQYLACGQPVVAALAEDHDFIREYGFGTLVECEDTKSLADAIRYHLEQPDDSKTRQRRFAYVAERRAYPVLASRLIKEANALWAERGDA